MEAIITSAIGHYTYGSIAANTLRNSVDNLFPTFAKNLDADYISGFHHRYKGGHDLLIDVPKTFSQKGFIDGFHHSGHIILTDFPTKAGIPIPGFSATGLGTHLESIGITKGWLNINIMDGAIGFLAISESHTDLLNALSGNLDMNIFVFFDTYIEGSLEIALGMMIKNPFLVGAGIENIFAGIVSTYQTLTTYINPIDFFGAGLGSALIGFGLSFAISSKNIDYKLLDSIVTGLKSGSLGMIFSISYTFGFGLMCGYIAYSLGKKLAKDGNQQINRLMTIEKEQFEIFFNQVNQNNISFLEFWNNISTYEIIEIEPLFIDNKLILLNNQFQILENKYEYFTNDLEVFKVD